MLKSRKRINSIEVSQIIQEIKQMSKDSSIYNKLHSYDNVIKKYKIDPLDQTALEIYQFLIEQQTLQSLPTKSRVKMDSFKFSRTHIQIPEQDQFISSSSANKQPYKYQTSKHKKQPQVKNQQSQQQDEVQDPQLRNNDKLFSFAKNYKNSNKKAIKQEQLRPKQLFNQIQKRKQKSKSDNKNKKKKNIHYISDQQASSIFSELQNSKDNQSYSVKQKLIVQNELNQQNKLHSRSAKTISHLSNSQSQSNLSHKNIVFNSQKTKEIVKHQQFGPKQQLIQYLRYKYLNELKKSIKRQKSQMIKSQKDKRIRYIYCMGLLKKGFKGLIHNYIYQKQNQRKADQFYSLKSEQTLQQYFHEWRQFTQLSDQSKQRSQLIQQKFYRLSGCLLLNRLKNNVITVKQYKQKKQFTNNILLNKSILLYKTIFMNSFKFKYQMLKQQNNQKQQLKKLSKTSNSIILLKLIRQNFIKQQQQQQIKVKSCITKIKGRLLIQNIKNQLNFVQVYWNFNKNNNHLKKSYINSFTNHKNSGKIIFLYYLLSTVKYNFQRLGYKYQWMTQFDSSIDLIDKKLQMRLSKYIKQKAFKRLNNYMKDQRQRINKVKIMVMDSFMKRLAFSSYIQYRKKSQQYKSQQLMQYIYQRNGSRLIQILDNRQQKSIQLKSKELQSYLQSKKIKQFYLYIQSYKRTKEYYKQVIQQYKQRRYIKQIQRIWINFKRVLKQQIINNKLCNQYLKLKANLIKQKCFMALKDNVFEEKLYKKKQTNMFKLVISRMFNNFITKLSDNYKYQPKQKQLIPIKFNHNLQAKRKHQFFNRLTDNMKQKQLKMQIQQDLVRNYQSHLIQKAFKIMKFITTKSKQQTQIYNYIKDNHQNNIKTKTLSLLLSNFIQRKSTKQIYYILYQSFSNYNQKLLKSSFKSIQQFSNHS